MFMMLCLLYRQTNVPVCVSRFKSAFFHIKQWIQMTWNNTKCILMFFLWFFHVYCRSCSSENKCIAERKWLEQNACSSQKSNLLLHLYQLYIVIKWIIKHTHAHTHTHTHRDTHTHHTHTHTHRDTHILYFSTTGMLESNFLLPSMLFLYSLWKIISYRYLTKLCDDIYWVLSERWIPSTCELLLQRP